MAQMAHIENGCRHCYKEEAASFVPNVVSVIPHGVDLDRFFPSNDQKASWSKTGMPGDYGIINVGASAQKGYRSFCRSNDCSSS